MAAFARCFSMSRDSSKSISLVAILLLGWTLRISTLGQNRFLEDEALYASWGLQIATGQDPMLDRHMEKYGLQELDWRPKMYKELEGN